MGAMQLPDHSVQFQLDDYADRLLYPPLRLPGQRHPLQPQEKKWIGTNLLPVEMDGRTVSCIEGADEGSTVGTALSTGY